MKLLFRQRIFSWLDSYDIYNENGRNPFCRKARLSWGHCLKIYDAFGKKWVKSKKRLSHSCPNLNYLQTVATWAASKEHQPLFTKLLP